MRTRTMMVVVLVLGGGLLSLGCAPPPQPVVLDWSAVATPTAPPARDGVSLVYDAAIGKSVLFAGWNGSTNTYYSDTWTWDGLTWTKLAITGPNGAFLGSAYDSARQRVVAWGGGDQIWEFDGTSWTTRTVTPRPPGRQVISMTYDSARQRVVVFGGLDAKNPTPLSDTWEWDGTTWTKRTPAVSPPARAYHAMAYDAARQRVVMFGGDSLHGGSGVIYNDTWEWDGTAWTEFHPATSPPINDGHNMVYDSQRSKIVMMGRGETWEWDGSQWAKQSPATTPSSRSWFGMTFDSGRSITVAFGGWGNGYLNDTWEYRAT